MLIYWALWERQQKIKAYYLPPNNTDRIIQQTTPAGHFQAHKTPQRQTRVYFLSRWLHVIPYMLTPKWHVWPTSPVAEDMVNRQRLIESVRKHDRLKLWTKRYLRKNKTAVSNYNFPRVPHQKPVLQHTPLSNLNADNMALMSWLCTNISWSPETAFPLCPPGKSHTFRLHGK